MDERFPCDRCGDEKSIAEYRVVNGYRWKKCRACIATQKRERRQKVRDSLASVQERERKAETTAWARRRLDREERERKARRKEAEATARTCKVCGRRKPIDHFRPIRGGKYRMRFCLVCERIKEREYRRTDKGKAVQKAWEAKHPRRQRKSGNSTERTRAWRATPLGKLSTGITWRKRKIFGCRDEAKVARWEADIATCKALIDKIRRDLDCEGKRGPKPPGYGSIRIPDPKA